MLKIVTATLVAGIGFIGSADAGKVSDVFAAYTADYPSTTEYNARVHPNKAHLCVSFRLAEPAVVKIRWKVIGEDGVIRFYAISTDHDTEDELGQLQPGIYNKCFHPPELEPGRYSMTVSVRARDGGRTLRDGCKFEISGFGMKYLNEE